MNTLKIPIKTLLQLVADSRLLRAYCIWGRLKMMYGHGAIHGWDTVDKKQHIANSLRICLNTLKKYISLLKEKGIVWIEGNILRLGGKHLWNELMDVSCEGVWFKTITFSIGDLTEDTLKFTALKVKREQIEWRQKEGITNTLMKKFGTVNDESTGRKLRKSLKAKAEGIYEQYSEDVSYNFFGKRKYYGFLDSNMCGLSIAQFFGRKTGVTGNRFLRRMEKRGKVKVFRRKLRLARLTIDTSILEEKKILLSEGFICRNLPLSWTPNIVKYSNIF